MVKIRIIPCLDVKDGRVVKGINFLNLIDAGDPVEQAKHYSDNGADEICFLDISASLENRDTMINVVKKTANEVFIPLTVGGGISSIENIQALLKKICACDHPVYISYLCTSSLSYSSFDLLVSRVSCYRLEKEIMDGFCF